MVKYCVEKGLSALSLLCTRLVKSKLPGDWMDKSFKLFLYHFPVYCWIFCNTDDLNWRKITVIVITTYFTFNIAVFFWLTSIWICFFNIYFFFHQIGTFLFTNCKLHGCTRTEYSPCLTKICLFSYPMTLPGPLHLSESFLLFLFFF